jgi:hypothetical protein
MRRIALFVLLFACIMSCRNHDKKAVAENNIDAARNFIRAALDGKFDEAKNYMWPDSINLNYLDVARRSYEKNDQTTRNNYRSSSINIHQVMEPVKDSLTIVIFSNSFKNDHDTLKVLKINGEWLVDLKYLYEHDMDTTMRHIPVAVHDTLK